MSTFKSALAICGLSYQEAAEFLEVSQDAIKSWATGRRIAPMGVWDQLASLFRQIERAADEAADTMDLEGVDPDAFGQFSANIKGDELPSKTAAEVAGAMALLMVLAADAEDAL